ncbi:MAG: hypothetical protein Q8O59_01485, partial [bacterium]|nr:hypothetical protein [bacterium]
AMASLLHICCSNCAYRCAAFQLTREMLDSIKDENEEIYKGLMALSMICVFCQQTEVFMPMELLG